MPKELQEIVYDRFEIFYKSKRIVITLDPKNYNRKNTTLMGKYFIKILKELTKE